MSVSVKAGRKPARTPADATGATRRSGMWWGGVGCGGLVVLAPGSATLLAALLAPVVVIALLPSRHGRTRQVQASLLFGLAAGVHPLHMLWMGDTSLTAAIALLRQPTILPAGWIALMGGWLLSEVASIALRVQADITASGQRRRMMEQIATIEEEWGPMPASAPLPPL